MSTPNNNFNFCIALFCSIFADFSCVLALPATSCLNTILFTPFLELVIVVVYVALDVEDP